VNRPEDGLNGVAYFYNPVNSDIVVENTASWPYANTGLTDGTHLEGLLGYEVDKMFHSAPAGTSRIGHSPIQTAFGTEFADMTVYQGLNGSTVFATGSMQWNWGLDDYGSPGQHTNVLNAAAQQITRNLLARFGAHRY
jgi:hypothetical protein